jgi:hypothetical protein
MDIDESRASSTRDTMMSEKEKERQALNGSLRRLLPEGCDPSQGIAGRQAMLKVRVRVVV